jgi:uncharacterized membrane protein
MFWDLLIIFFGASITGWVMELFYRRIVEKENTTNPGFLNGPYLPIYGSTGAAFFLVCAADIDPFLKFAVLLVFPTLLELLVGLYFRHYYHVILWDYSEYTFNYRGMICPQFSVYWIVLALAFNYYLFPFLSHQLDRPRTEWTYFVLGGLAGIMAIDIWTSFHLMKRIKRFVAEYNRKYGVKLRLDYAAFERKFIRQMNGRRNKLKQYFPHVNEVTRKKIKVFLDRYKK